MLPFGSVAPAQSGALAQPAESGGAGREGAGALHSVDLGSLRARSAGLTAEGGGFWATGPGYRGRIAAGGFEFEAGGARLALRPMALEQGGMSLELAAAEAGLELDPSEPRRGSRALAAGVRERFEATPLGVEHSLWLASRPAGDGELVVRFALESELRPRADGAGLRLEGEGGQRLSIGALTGIDAQGRTVAGELRLADGELHYVLPDAFLDEAAWPVLLDPLIGSPLTLDSGSYQGQCVAHSGTSNGYLVAWVDKASAAATQGNLVAQRLSSSGALVGGQIALDTTGRAQVARLGWSRLNNRYLAVWSQADLANQTDLIGRTIDASNGALGSGGALLFTTTLSEAPVALSNETSTADDELLLLFDNGSGSSSLRQVTVPVSGVPAFTGNTLVPGVNTGGTAEQSVALSTQGGPAGRFAFLRTDAIFVNDLLLRVLDRNCQALTPVLTLADGSDFPGLGSFSEPAIDSDGERFVCAWRIGESRIGVATYRFDATTSSLQTVSAPRVLASAPLFSTYARPSVAWTPEGCLVGWAVGSALSPGSGDEDYLVQLIDTLSGQNSGPLVSLPGDLAVTRALASQGQGSDVASIADTNQDDEALILFGANCSVPCTPDLVAQRFTIQGRVENLGGGCGAGGSASATGLTPGVIVRMHLDLDLPNVTTFALIGLPGSGLPCGGCTLFIEPTSMLVVTRTTESYGATRVDLAVPNNPATVGAVAALQWVTPSLSPQCSALSADFSNAVRLTIE